MDKCRKCGAMFKGIGKLCSDCKAEISEKLDKGRKLFNQQAFESKIIYNLDTARFECTNRDGFWVSYNGDNWIQATKAKNLSDENKCNPLQKMWDSSAKEKGFVKADSGKLQWSLLPFEELKDVVKVLMLGAKKYTPDNWKKCDDVTRYKDALMRHVISYVSGDKTDEESQLSHLAHAVCNCLFLMYFDNTKKEE